MKKILLPICALLLSFGAFSQSLKFLDPHNSNADVSGTTVSVSADADYLNQNPSTPELKLYVKNINSTSDSIKVGLKRYELKPYVDSTSNYFCWGATCLGASVSGSQPIRYNDPADIVYIKTNEINKTLSIYYDPNNYYTGTFLDPKYISGNQQFLFVAYDINNPNDSVGVTVSFDITSGINELSKNDYSVKVGPNPSNGQMKFTYDFKKNYSSKYMQIYDLLGNKVKTVAVNSNKGIINLNATDLNSGIYFYHFMLDNKATSPQKLIITK